MSADLETRIQEALEQSEAGESEGLEKLVTLTTEHADSSDAWRARAQAENELGQPEAALKSIDKALELDQEDAESWLVKAELHLDQDQFEQALEALDKGIDADEDDADLWFEKGATLMRLGDFEGALHAFDRVVHLEPDHLRAVFNRGDMLSRMGHPEEACKAYEKAAQLSPKDSRNLTRLGQARLDARHFTESLEAFDKAIEINENDWEAWSNRGLALVNLDRFEEALKCYDKAVAIEPKNPVIFYNKAVACEMMEDLSGALDALRAWIEIEPERAEAFFMMGRLQDRLGFKEEAQKNLDHALKLNPGILGPMAVWGLALVDEQGQPHPSVQPVQVQSNMPPQEVARQFVEMLVAQHGHKIENGLIDGKYKVAVMPVNMGPQMWGVGLFDENGQPNPEVPPMQVQTDLPPDKFVGDYIKMLQEQGHTVDEQGMVDGKFRVGVFPLQGAPPPPTPVA